VIPVSDDFGVKRGAAILLRDISREASLTHRCLKLSDVTTRDPLTGCANRTALDKRREELVGDFRRSGTPSVLIICDLDHFKAVNDNYGHQAGDDVIVSLANLLREAAGPKDLAARYGGEEFVLLCSECDIQSGMRRAEQLRRDLSRLNHARLGGQRVTGSFGVAQVEPGDTSQSFLHRADRALLIAKERGRNRVEQLGEKHREDAPKAKRGFLRRWLKLSSEVLVERELITPGPWTVCVKKLRGFIEDHNAKLLKVKRDKVEFMIDGTFAAERRRQDDRSFAFTAILSFLEVRPTPTDCESESDVQQSLIQIDVKILTNNTTERRRRLQIDTAMAVLCRLKSYLMALPEENAVDKHRLRETISVTLPPFSA
jgi:diguanylate cyclase (GGDEF)-like protein